MRTQLKDRPTAPIDFVAVTPGSEELLGIPASWRGVQERLLTYSLAEVLDLLGRISILLNSEGGLTSPVVQGEIISGLFGNKTPVWKRLEQFSRQQIKENGAAQTVVVFHDAQVANTVKAALLAIPPDHQPPGEVRSDHRRLGQALLIVNSLISDQSEILKDLDSEAASRDLEMYVLANGIFYAGGAGVQDFARASELYLRDRTSLHAVSGYRDLAAEIKLLTGLDPESLWAIFFAFYARMASTTREKMPLRGARLTKESLFGSHQGFTSEQIDSFFALLAQDVEDLRAAAIKRYSWDNIRPFDFVTLARRPFVRIDDEYFLLGLRFLEEKLTTGLHHIFLDPRTGLRKDEDRQVYLTFMGYVWEDYVRELLERAYLSTQAAVLVGEGAIKQRVTGKSIDSIVVVGDVALLIESKATLLTLEVRTGTDWGGYEGKLQDLVFDAAEQIDRTMQAVESGVFADLGVNPTAIRRYVPVVASMEPSIMNPLLAVRTQKVLEANGWLQGERVTALQILDPSEMELLEMGVEAGRPMHSLLERKADDANLSKVSFRNFLISLGDPVLDGRNSYLAERFSSRTQEAIKYLQQYEAESQHRQDANAEGT
jgi:hypothetical protein